MKPIKTFTISPLLPDRLKRLYELAYNLRWSWNADMRELFRRLDMDLWEEVGHNPVLLLSRIDQKILEKRAQDDSYVYMLDQIAKEFDQSMQRTTWYQQEKKLNNNLKIAYFSMEYGISESLPVYSGGLGVLSGDHLKSSSELGIPLIGVGLSYQKGYFQQHLTVSGWQEENYPINDFYNMPLSVQSDENGAPHLIKVTFPGREVQAKIWKAQIGRIPLYLLDTNIEQNAPEDRRITSELYGGDDELRIKQEIILGMGGIKALSLTEENVCIYHLNEGHSAFSGLERIKILIKDNDISFDEAFEVVKRSSIFTTHTPVKAGIDIFPPEMIKKYFSKYCEEVGITIERLLALGCKGASNGKEDFSMAILAINQAYKTNAVSRLHGAVSRQMWKSLWPNVLTQEIPITSVTNGVHQASWISKEMSELFDRYLGPRWLEEPADQSTWKKVLQIPDGELWRTHERRRARLVGFARRQLEQQYREMGLPVAEIDKARSVLNPEALTIGFARRFATYKRATLIFRDPERLAKILTDKERPVQIIIAGKAHPKDAEGKEYIRQILKLAQQPPFRQYVVFLENYNMNIARYLVQGCDVWLNTPRRGREACGTSGMKAAANGLLNFSTLDGWWDEIYCPEIGWALGEREEHDDFEYWDQQEAIEIYKIMEDQIIPMFYTRGADQMPRDWINKMKQSMVEICPLYNTNRMLQEYTFDFYTPAAARLSQLTENNYELAKNLTAWKQKVKKGWDSIRFLNVESDETKDLSIKSKFTIQTDIYLDGLDPADIDVQIYYGKLNSQSLIQDGKFLSMQNTEKMSENKYRYRGEISDWVSGLNGFTLRIIPSHAALANPFEDGLIYWFGKE